MFLYTFQNIIKAPKRSFQLILSSILVFSLFFFALAFQHGMNTSLSVSGDEKNIILLGAGSEESIERSELSPMALAAVKSIRGLLEVSGKQAVSPEVVYNSVITFGNYEKEAFIRGVTDRSFLVYSNLALEKGAYPSSGEVLIGRRAALRMGVQYKSLQIGDVIVFEGQEFKISGVFKAPGSVMESEVWMNLQDLMSLTRRDAYSSITMRLDTAEESDVNLMVKRRQDIQATSMSEKTYYQKVSNFYEPMKWIAWLTALLIALGALLGGMNSFYAALDSRKKEFATLQAIGFKRRSLFLSMVLESGLLHLLGYLLASYMALWLLPELSFNIGTIFFKLELGFSQMIVVLWIAFFISLLVTLIPAVTILKPSLQTYLKD